MDSSEILSRSQTKTYILGQENLEDTQFSKNLQVWEALIIGYFNFF